MTRARDAASSVRLSVLAMAVATISVNAVSRCSVSAGSSPVREATPMLPHRRDSTRIGLATADRMPSVRRLGGSSWITVAPE
jgi:hypothetical protein